ncbi:MAG: acetyl-CoA C-acyltransferase [Bacteroidetes bacterium]|nr:acetyl-CoA C-acyltransferase [Bacteroidota bacterium]MCK6610108.1 acetyl-CoA C-acyltransferase [Bacteroidia bacterium]
MKKVYIVSAVRTPIGAMNGALSSLSATQLGSIAIKGAIEKAGINPDQIQEVYMGNVISAGLGQAPATQAMIGAGIPNTVPSTTVNKVCASGSKAIMLAAQSIMMGINDIAIAGGMESMSNIPYYLDKARTGYRLGHGTLVDGLIKDGLWDVYKDFHMGNAAEICAREYNFTREDQDAFAIESYTRAQNAYAKNAFADEIIPVTIPVRGKDPIVVSVDEEYTKVNFEKLKTLKPAFEKEGTITAANASKLNDGASALVLVSEEKMIELGLKPLARIVAFADAAQAPEWFTTTPALAIPKALKWAGIDIKDVDFFELNEAFSVVGLVNNKLLGIDDKKVNVYGGAVALGHPIGSSGARIVTTLTTILNKEGGRYGVTGICNGGGGASAIVLEKA